MRPEILFCLLAAVAASSVAASTGGGLAEAVVGVVRGCAAAADASECVGGRALDAIGHSLSAAMDKWRLADIPLLGHEVVLLASERAPRTLFTKGAAAAPDQIVHMIADFLQSRTLQLRIPKEIIPKNLEEGEFCSGFEKNLQPG